MSRPTRVAAAKLKNYSEVNDTDESDTHITDDEEDESFDEDEDPDKTEVPGVLPPQGTSVLEEAEKLAMLPKSNNRKSNPSSSMNMGYMDMGYVSKESTPTTTLPKSGKRGGGMISGPSNNYNFLQNINLPEGTTCRPSQLSTPNPLFDSSMFFNPSFNYMNPNPMDSIQRLFSMIPKADSNSAVAASNQLLELYGNLLGKKRVGRRQKLN